MRFCEFHRMRIFREPVRLGRGGDNEMWRLNPQQEIRFGMDVMRMRALIEYLDGKTVVLEDREILDTCTGQR